MSKSELKRLVLHHQQTYQDSLVNLKELNLTAPKSELATEYYRGAIDALAYLLFDIERNIVPPAEVNDKQLALFNQD